MLIVLGPHTTAFIFSFARLIEQYNNLVSGAVVPGTDFTPMDLGSFVPQRTNGCQFVSKGPCRGRQSRIVTCNLTADDSYY